MYIVNDVSGPSGMGMRKLAPVMRGKMGGKTWLKRGR